jgi:hypothetical protein
MKGGESVDEEVLRRVTAKIYGSKYKQMQREALVKQIKDLNRRSESLDSEQYRILFNNIVNGAKIRARRASLKY